MQYCYQCGEAIEFFHDGFRAIPVHPSGSCRGRSWGSGSWGGSPGLRTTSEGYTFHFPFVTFPSYVNPNARCPVCGAEVYFYQSPYGGRVFFDELGPPWPKHPCTDNPRVREAFSTSKGRAGMLNPQWEEIGATRNTNSPEPAPNSIRVLQRKSPMWLANGWMPFVVSEVIYRRIGIEAVGQLFAGESDAPRKIRILQTDMDARFWRQQGKIRMGFSLPQNSNLILSILNESPVFLQCTEDASTFGLSSFILTQDELVEEIAFNVRVENT